jgi:peptide chain release factor subunit 1
VISEKELQELAGFRSLQTPALSLYLNTDLTQQPKEQFRLVLRDLLEQVRGIASAEDVSRVDRFIDHEFDWQAKGLAIFAAANAGLWGVYPLALPVSNEVHVGERLYVKPLATMLEEYDRYGVVLLDSESARFFLIHMGQIEEKQDMAGEELKRHKQGGKSASRFQRRSDLQAGQNLKAVAQATVQFYAENDCRGLVLAGNDATLALFQPMLPKASQKHVMGTMTLEMTATATQVLDRAAELIRVQSREREARLVEELITAAAKGGGAVIGPADTYYAVHQGRVRTLVVEKDFEADGYQCPGCQYISAEPITKCPFCGDKLEPVAEAVNRVVRRTIEAGGHVETTIDNDALAKAGHIGAVLRY